MTQAIIKIGFNAWYKEWAKRPENMMFAIPILSVVQDGEQIEILDTHMVNGEEFCTIKAPGLGGSIHSQWLEKLEP